LLLWDEDLSELGVVELYVKLLYKHLYFTVHVDTEYAYRIYNEQHIAQLHFITLAIWRFFNDNPRKLVLDVIVRQSLQRISKTNLMIIVNSITRKKHFLKFKTHKL